MSKKEQIKDFVIEHKEYFDEGIDIPSLMRKWRKEKGYSIDRMDSTDALTELRKEGVLRNDFKSLSMKFIDK